MRRGWGALLAVAAFVGACQADVKVPDNAQLECQKTADCPHNQFCNSANRCIVLNAANSVPPDLASPPAVTPAVGRKDTTFHVTVVSTKALRMPPVVSLQLVPPVAMQCAPQEGLQYDCTYQATAAENDGKGGLVAFDVTLTDLAGNVAPKKSAGYLNMDFLAPSLADFSVTPQNAKRGATVHVFFAASEPVVGDIYVTSSQKVGGQTSFKATNVAGTNIYTVDPQLHWSLDDPGNDPDGQVSFSVTLTDTAGNPSKPLTIGKILVDQHAPDITPEWKDPQVYSEVAGHNVVTVKFGVAKAVDAPGELRVTMDQSTFACNSDQAAMPNYTCTYPVTGTEGSGAHTVVVHTEDEAGNVSDATDTVTLDFRIPKLTVSASATPLGQGQTPVVLVSSDKAIQQTPVPTVMQNGVISNALGMPSGTGSATSWVFSYSPVAAGLAGSFDVTVNAVDDVGHAFQNTATITVDGQGPKISDPQTLGNQDAPTTLFGKVAPYNQLKLTFNSTKPLVGPTATLGALCPPPAGSTGAPTACTLKCQNYQATTPNYTCLYPVTGQELTADGVAIDTVDQASLPISIQGEDEAGNRVTAGTSVTFDFAAPKLATVKNTPDAIGAGQTEDLVFTTNEPLGPTPVVTATGPAMLSFSWVQDSSYTFGYAVHPTDQNGDYQSQISLTDLVGNTTTPPLTGPSFQIDVNTPVIPSADLMTNATRFSNVPGYNRIQLAFDVTKSLDVPGASLNVALGAICPSLPHGECAFTCSPYQSTSPNYTCSYLVTGDEVTEGGQPIASLAEADVAILVAGVDEAGNKVAASADVTLDFTPPSLVSASPAPLIVGVNQLESLQLVPSEQLAATPTLTVNGPGTLNFQPVTNTTYSFQDQIQSTDTSGSYTSTVTMTDLVGNTASAVAGPAFAVDTLVPTISRVVTSAAAYSEVAGHNLVTLTFDVSKSLDGLAAPGGLTVTLDGSSTGWTCGSYQSSSPNYTCHYSVTNTAGSKTAQGKIITVEAVDEAGNSSAASTAVVFDFSPLTITAHISPAQAKAGEVPVLTVTSTKPLLQAPTVTASAVGTANGSLGTPTAGGSGEAWAFTYSGVSSNVDGTFALTANATDAVGHAATPVVVNLTDIGTAPHLSSVSTTSQRFSAVNGYNQLTVNVSSAEVLSSDAFTISASVGNYPLTCSAYHSSSPNFTCTYTFQGTEKTPDGTLISSMAQAVMPISVKVSDQVGNAATGGASVTVDFTKPDLAGAPTIAYVPGSVGVLSQVTAARAGSTVALSFTTTEPLGSTPSVTSSPAGLAYALASGASNSTSFVYDATVATGSPPDRSYGLSITLTDLVGNTNLLTPASPSAVVDTTAPTPPDTTYNPPTSSNIVYHRTPTGDATSSQSYFSVSGAAGAVAAGTLVLVLDGSDPSSSSLIGHANADSTGAFSITLDRADRAAVYVAAQDEAGNISTTANLVHDVVWTSSFVGKTPNNDQSNPNELDSATDVLLSPVGSMLFGALDQPSATEMETTDYSDVTGIADGSSLAASAEQHAWNDRATSISAVSGRAGAAMAYDAVRGRIVMFGGQGNAGPALGDTWEFDGSDWINATSNSVNPPSQTQAAMAYDAANGHTILLRAAGTLANPTSETWEWDGTTWSNVTPQGLGAANPSGRVDASMAYDSARGKVVLFGGYWLNGNFSTLYNDTWEWDGTRWTEVTPTGTGTSPSPRHGAAAAYDSVHGEMLVFGGATQNSIVNELWGWNGTTWTNLTPASGSPSARQNSSLVFDTQAGVALLFGGLYGSSYYGGTFTWDGTKWTSVSTSGPSGRYQQAMAYDSAHGRTVLFGGADSTGDLSDAWQWDGKAWTGITPNASNPPPPRFGHNLSFDSSRGRTVVFGGYYGGGLSDTWEWNGTAWTTTMATPPPARYEHSMTYDSVRNQTIMFGGYKTGTTSGASSDLWTWNGSSWTPLSPMSSPPARYDAPMAFDSGHQVAVLFGGHGTTGFLGDTWSWNGSQWMQKTYSSGPSSREGSVMAYDSARGRLVLFGGYNGSLLGDTWEWDGMTWSQKSTTGPAAREWSAMAYDPVIGRTILFGGSGSGSSILGDLWAWDGTTWTQITPAVLPPSREESAMVYDSVRDCLVLYGGQAAGGLTVSDTWEDPSAPARRAGAIAKFDFGRAIANDLQPVTIESMSFDTYAGATGYGLTVPGTGAAQPGVTLAAWDAWSGAWKQLNAKAYSSTAAAEVAYTATSAAEAERYLLSGTNMIDFGVFSTSGQGNGAAAPVVSLDYAQLTVEYKH